MILKQIIKIVAIFAISFSWGQEIKVDIQKTKMYESENKFFGLNSIVDDGSDGFVALREFSKATFTDKRFFEIEFYDKTMKLTKSFELDFTKVNFANRESEVLGLIVNNGLYHVIEFGFDKETEYFVCNAMSAKLGDNKFQKKELFKVGKDKLKTRRSFGSSALDSDMTKHMFFNKNKDAFGVVVDVIVKDKDVKDIFVFDTGFNKMAEYNFEKNIKDENCILEKMILSENKKDVYLLNRIWRDNSKERKEFGDCYYDLSKISEGNKINSVQIKGEGKDQFDFSEIKLNNNSLYFVGYYYGAKEVRKGLAVFEFNTNDLALKSNKFNVFTEKIISDKQNAKGKTEWHPIIINDIHFDSTGLLVCGEEYYQDSTGSHPNTYFFTACEDIYVEKINLNNEVYWEGFINKKQTSSNYVGFLTTRSFYKDGVLYFISNVFKDDKLDDKNLPILKLGKTLSCFKIDKDGVIEYKELINGENRSSFVKLNGTFYNSNNMFLFMGSNIDKNEYQYYKITF